MKFVSCDTAFVKENNSSYYLQKYLYKHFLLMANLGNRRSCYESYQGPDAMSIILDFVVFF